MTPAAARSSDHTGLPLWHLLLALLVAAAVLVRPVLLKPAAFPYGDAPRYVAAGLALLDHGVISGEAGTPGKPPRPGLITGGPLIAFELALVMGLDHASHTAFRCALGRVDPAAPCPAPGPGVQIAHWLELTGFALCAWLAGWLLFRRRAAAWLTLLLVLACRELTEEIVQPLTEPLSYLLFGPFLLAWLQAWRSRHPAWWAGAGATLGLLILAKPAAMAILPAAAGLLVLAMLWRRVDMRGGLVAMAAIAGACLLVLLPLLLRNAILTGHAGLSEPSYLGTTFAHRIAYDAMSWREWLAGWLFYLPDFGDNLARAWLPAGLYARLDWGPDSYYVHGRDVLYQSALAAAGALHVPSYLVETYILPAPLKHLAVTVLLAWRGLFVGRVWGLVALVLLPAALLAAPQQQRRLLLLMLAPGAVLLFGQAFLSVSITRYNGMLVLPLALTTAGLVVSVLTRWQQARRRSAPV